MECPENSREDARNEGVFLFFEGKGGRQRIHPTRSEVEVEAKVEEKKNNSPLAGGSPDFKKLIPFKTKYRYVLSFFYFFVN